MTSFVTKDIRRLLRAIDAGLESPCTLLIIGGAAAALAYRVRQGTYDIDTLNDISPVLPAYRHAIKVTGLSIPLSEAHIAEAPYHYEKRLRTVSITGLRNLLILVPEKHDLVLMKVIRGSEKDMATAAEIAQRMGLSAKVLFNRFTTEMSHVIGDPRSLTLSFLSCLERVFGENEAQEASELLKKRVKNKT